MNFHDIQEFLHNNQFASGGLLIGTVGAAAAYCRAVPARAWNFFKSKFVVSVEVLDSQEIHTWFNVWMSKHDYAKKSRRLVAWNKYPDRNLAWRTLTALSVVPSHEKQMKQPSAAPIRRKA